MLRPVPNLVQDTIRRRDLLVPGQSVLVAVSGGQDSCALLHVLADIRTEWRLSLHAAHFHHGLRGPAADADADFVRDLCHRWDVPLTIGRGSVAAAAKRTKTTIQEAARNERHAFLARTAETVGTELIAFAHTSDDRVETILLNMFRGSGLDGLCALPPRQGNLIRPLCDVSRAMTGSYCRSIGIVPRRDISNRQLRYSRNRIRAELIPYLEALINPSARGAILRMADMLSDELSFLEHQAKLACEQHVRVSEAGAQVISGSELLGMHPALSARVVRQMIEAVAGSCSDVNAEDVHVILQALATGDRLNRTLRCGAHAIVEDELTIQRKAWSASARCISRELPVPGCVYVHEDGICMSAQLCDLIERPASVAPFEAAVPWDCVQPPLVVRTICAGDRIRPLGLGGSKSVRDHLRDAGLKASRRRGFKLVADARGVLWLPGVALDERARITAVPCRVVRLTLSEEESGG